MCGVVEITNPAPTANNYGLFNPDEDPTKGYWLEERRTLEYYHLKSGVSGCYHTTNATVLEHTY